MNLRFFITPVLIISALVSVIAQPGPMSSDARERIESQRIAFITQRMRLTPDEATKFWPVYNEYRDALKDMRDDFERPDLENISDEEASKLIDRHLLQEQKKLELKRTLLTKLRGIVSPRKILQLHVAENAFNRELLRRAQEHRKP
jgi:hypothetical protein